MIKGTGNLYAKMILVGEAPGTTETKSGIPFSGSAGRILDGMLSEIGIHRNGIWLDNVMPIQPKGNDFTLFYDKGKKPSKSLIAGKELLYRTIKKIKPNIVVALGNEALQALTSHNGIGKWRGSIYYNKELDIKVIGTYHPASVMRQWENRPLVIHDLKRAEKESKIKEYIAPKYNIDIVRNVNDAYSYTKLLMSKKDLTFDIETGGGELRCIGFSWDKRNAIVFPFNNLPSNDKLSYFKCIREILQSDVPKIAQNAQYDITFMKYKYKTDTNNLLMDTMIAFHCIYPELPKSLATLCSIYTPHPFYKDMWKSEDDEDLYRYNGLDCAVTYEAYENLKDELKEFGMEKFYYEHSHSLIEPLIDMQIKGVKIDLDKRDELKHTFEAIVYKAQTELNLAFGMEINVNSPKQMKELLYDKLKLPKQYNRKTGTLTADEKAIEKLSLKSDSKELKKVITIRHHRKLLSDSINIDLLNDRMHTSYNIAGTVTGRLSSGRSLPLGTGTNLQNICKDVRGMYIPDNGMKFVSADLKQAEARVVAYIAGDERLIKVIESGEDIFVKVGQWVFEKESISKEERFLCKGLIHGSNYGMSARTFRIYANLNTISEAEDLQNRYFNSFPMVKQWQASIVNTLRKGRVLTSLLNRKRIFFGRWGNDLFRDAYSFIPQATVSDGCNIALRRLYNRNLDVILQVHDNVVVQVPADIEDSVIINYIKEAFDIKLIANNREFVIPVDVEQGNSWGDLKHMATIVY